MLQLLSSRSLSVGTKLLLVITVLLFLVITFLNISAILIVGEDKRAYIYDAQSAQTLLIGTEFVNNAKRGIDVLRLGLANVDLTRPLDASQDLALKSVIENQNDISALILGKYIVAAKEFVLVGKYIPKKNAQKFPASLLTLDPSVVKTGMGFLVKQGFNLFNSARAGMDPYLGVIVTDPTFFQKNSPEIPIAIGFIPQLDLINSIQGSNLSIVASSGELVFDTDSGRLVSSHSFLSDPLLLNATQSTVNQGAMEFEEDDKKYLGSYVKPGFGVVAMTRTEWKQAQRAVYSLIEKFLLLGLIAVGVSVVLGIVFAKTLTKPILKLFEATKQISKGDFNVTLAVESKDELGALTESFNSMSKQITELIEEKIEKVKLENELDIASTVQQTLMPPNHFESERVKIVSHYQSASQCGGDWWGFFTERNKTVLMIADATGHGFPSALITASARSCFSFMHKLSSEDPDFTFSPGAMLAYANRVIFEASLGNIMMTFFIAVFDPDSKTLTYSSAGHNPPWLFKKNDQSYQLKSLTSLGNRLGEARDTPDFEEHTVDVSTGDILFMYTDGIIEGKNLQGEMFGKKRVKKLVEVNLSDDDLNKPVQNLMEDFLKHNEGKSFDDDVTLVFTKFINT